MSSARDGAGWGGRASSAGDGAGWGGRVSVCEALGPAVTVTTETQGDFVCSAGASDRQMPDYPGFIPVSPAVLFHICFCWVASFPTNSEVSWGPHLGPKTSFPLLSSSPVSDDCPTFFLLSPPHLPFLPFSLCIYDNKISWPAMQRWISASSHPPLRAGAVEGSQDTSHIDDILLLFALFYSKILGPDHMQGG